MNLLSEFNKIRSSFIKVKEDVTFLSDKIYDNYDEFMKHHLKLVKEVKNISQIIKEHSNNIKEMPSNKFSDKHIFHLTSDIKDIKNLVKDIQKGHKKIEKSIDDISQNKSDIKQLKEKYQNSELEIYLLKERLLEQDTQLKQIKDINRHMFETIEELSKIEIELINKKQNR